MKRLLLVLQIVLAGVGCQSSPAADAQQGPGLPQKRTKEPMTEKSGERLADRLDLGAITQVALQTFDPKEPVSEKSFRALLARGRLVSPPAGLADPFSYSPWFCGTFRLSGEPYAFQCFLGNRCKITLPSGEVLVVDAE